MSKTIVSLSKKSKKDNPRAKFLSVFMKELSNHPEVVDNFSAGNIAKFKGSLLKLASVLTQDMEKEGKHEK